MTWPGTGSEAARASHTALSLLPPWLSSPLGLLSKHYIVHASGKTDFTPYGSGDPDDQDTEVADSVSGS